MLSPGKVSIPSLAAPGVPVPTCFFNFVLSKFYANVSCHQKIIKPKQVLSLARVSIHSQVARGVPSPTLLVGSNYLLDLTQRNACHQSNKNRREAAAKVSIPSQAARGVACPTLSGCRGHSSHKELFHTWAEALRGIAQQSPGEI